MNRFSLLLLLSFLWCAPPGLAQFFSGPPKAVPSLVADQTAVAPARTFQIGIRFRMEDGWHLYWRFPGDSGAAPQVEWQLPEGFKAGEIQWPLPHLLESEGELFTNVYEKEVLLPVQISAPALLPPEPLVFKARLKWYVCKETCVPGEEQVELSLPAGDPAPNNVALFERWAEQLPQNAPPPFETQLVRTDDALEVRIPKAGRERKLELFPIPPAGTTAERARLLSSSELESVFRITVPEGGSRRPGWGALIVVNAPDGSRKGWEIFDTSSPASADNSTAPRATAASPAKNSPATPAEKGLAGILWAAFLGGMLLNLMPCVLPVIALKILGFTQQAGEAPRKVLQLGLAFCAGVFAFFLGIAGAVIGLKAMGSGLNWGFQFQNPWILTGLVSAVFVFGLNLLGVFEITLTGESTQTLSSLSSKRGLGGAFLHGAFTTLLGTSCTAPYLGVTLGFAMSQSAPVVITIFLTIAAGMSLPYLLLTSNPALLRFLPKPGMWMERLKQAMGFVMLCVAVWLLDVLGRARGLEAMSGTCAFLLVLGLGCWLLGILRNRSTALVLALLLVLAGYRLFLHENLTKGRPQTSSENTPDGWIPFTQERLGQHRAAGKAVFVDFTADWCLNCKVNERVALSHPEVEAAFRQHGVIKLKADWTSNDPAVTRELKKFGRASVPFYLLYVPGEDTPRILPVLLTPKIMLDELKNL